MYNEYPDQDQPQAPQEYGDVGQLILCRSCSRKFNPVAMQKHSKICEKVFVQKREAFDIKEQRKATDAAGKGLEDESYGRKKKAAPPKKEPPAKP